MREGVRFAKMSGSGNDFVLIDNREARVPPGEMAEWARKLCRRGLSVGADGIIFLEPAEGADFRWRFFNADGSEAEMCGNGGRCAARYAHRVGMAPAELRFGTLAGVIEAEVRGSRVKLLLSLPKSIRLDQELLVDGARRLLHSINTGVPHAVEFVGDLDAFDVAGVGRAIRRHEAFRPAGTNANFARVEGRGRIALRTYERGVEGETLACGTGAVAAALVAALRGEVDSPVEVGTRGGEVLQVHFRRGDDGFSEVRLEGETRLVYEGELTEEAFG